MMHSTAIHTGRLADRIGFYPPSYIDEILSAASDPAIISFAGGLPDPGLFPARELSTAFQQALTRSPSLSLQYNITEGYWPLRKFIADRFSRTHSCDIRPEQVLITHGAQQALDMAGKAFINEGDTVLTENPTFIGVLQAFAPCRPHYRPLEQQADGIDLAQLIRSLDIPKRPSLFYTMPRFQNPTGLSCSPKKREDIVNILRDRNIWIIEDDAYGELNFGDFYSRPFIGDLPEQSVYIGSFSKTIAPALRLGWMIAPPSVTATLATIKRASDTFSSFLTQVAVFDYLSAGSFDGHVREIAGAYAGRMETMIRCIREYFPPSTRYTIPKGGMFTWVTLPAEYDAEKIAQLLLQANIAVVPGRPFYAFRDRNDSFRLNFSNLTDERIKTGLTRMGTILHHYIVTETI